MKQDTVGTYYREWVDLSDRKLVDLVLEGEEGAFQVLIEHYQKLVFNIIFHYMGRWAEVEDIAQEVFLKVYRSLSSYDPERPMKAWIARITTNTCLDELRKHKIRKTDLFTDIVNEEAGTESFFNRFKTGSVVSDFEAKRVLDWLQGLMNELSDKDKMAFVLREVEGLEYSEISDAMETTEIATRIRVSRSKKKLLGSLRGMLEKVKR